MAYEFYDDPQRGSSPILRWGENGGSRCLHVERLEGCARKTEQGLEALGRNTHLWQAHTQKSMTVSRLYQHTAIMKLRTFSIMTYIEYLLT